VSGRGGPLVPAGRIIGLDVARYVALVGMIATHTLNPSTPSGEVTVVQQIAGGRASALFAVLAGVSLALMTGRGTPPRGRELRTVSAGLAVRALLVALLGILLGALPTTILVILAYYGVMFLLGIPFLRLRAPTLTVLAAAWMVLVPVLSQALRGHLPASPIQSPVPGSLADPGALLLQLTLTGTYPAVPWLGYLLAGLALGRLDLSRRRTPYDLVVVGGCLAVASWASSTILLGRTGARQALESTLPAMYGDGLEHTLAHGLYGTTPTGSWWWLAVDAPHSGTPFDLAHTTGSALAVIGVALVLGRLVPRLAAVLFGAGAMTLSLYSLHVLLRTPAFLPDDDVRTFLAHALVVTLVGAAYRLGRRSGPFERLVAELSGRAAGRREALQPR
jgi:uncharacterized membrane protein